MRGWLGQLEAKLPAVLKNVGDVLTCLHAWLGTHAKIEKHMHAETQPVFDDFSISLNFSLPNRKLRKLETVPIRVVRDDGLWSALVELDVHNKTWPKHR